MIDPVTAADFPVLAPVAGPPPAMPSAWTATVLLHPFGPPPSSGPVPDVPFFEMSIATIDYAAGQYLSARICGCNHNWWYVVTPGGTSLSCDNGATWTSIDIGWSLPSDWFGVAAPKAQCAGASPLNWLVARNCAWWKVPVPGAPGTPPGATWMWLDAETGEPVRMMFGSPPPLPTMGDPSQLALFQMFSLTHVASFRALDEAPPRPTQWVDTDIPGLAVGNPNSYKPFQWNRNFALTSFSTPVNEGYNPLATRTLYVWKDDADYQVYTDRAQSTLMLYSFNPDQPAGQEPIRTVTSLLTGKAPAGHANDFDGRGYLHTVYRNGRQACETGKDFSFGQEPPWWVSIPAVQGTIECTITDNPALAPGAVVTIWSVMFPPQTNYPDGTYLWAWYAPQNADGTESRPLLFMQSDSGVGVGTSLGLADYFWYKNFEVPLNPANFTIPEVCLLVPTAALRPVVRNSSGG